MHATPTTPGARDRGWLLSPTADLVAKRGSYPPLVVFACGEASGVCDLPSHGLSAQDCRGLRNPGTVQAVQHVIDGARRSLPGVGHRLDGFVHADRVQMELVDKEVVGMSGLDVPIAQDFSGKVVQARDQSGPGSRRSAGIQYPSAVMIIGSTWHGAATTPET